MSKSRTFSICLSDLPQEKMTKHHNGKVYINLGSYDNDEPDEYGNDFGISIPLTKKEVQAKKDGADIKRLFVGNGKIWRNEPVKTDPMNLDQVKETPDEKEDENDVPFT